MRTGRSAYIQRMNRVEIEIELHRGRAETLEWVTSLSDEELLAPRTQSENDPDSWWSHADHFIHTTLIEQNFNEMVRRHLRGEQGMDRAMVGEDGKALRPIEDVMAYVHAFTEKWKVEQQGKPLDELVRIGLAARADTLALLAELDDDQLASKIPGAPWADGTVGGVLSVHAGHARMHRQWSEAGSAAG
jgi:hypothetical protein